MTARHCLLFLIPATLLAILLHAPVAPACCPAPRFPSSKPVVNADQTVVMVWDAAAKTQHFIRQATFKSDADDFGFLVPSPSQPELSESGNEAFPHLMKVTAPEVVKVPRSGGGGIGCGCGAVPGGARSLESAAPGHVRVLEEKRVAGFDAAVLEATTEDALADWLKEHGYAFSPEVKAWAKPYIAQGWKITALKVAKDSGATDEKRVAAAALRLSFKTERPLFPYREPDTAAAAKTLEAKKRLLRIFFVADARYEGAFPDGTSWTGKVAWAGKLDAATRVNLLEKLKLPDTTGPKEWFLTEFEDEWPYQPAPGDVWFSRPANQDKVRRAPVYEYAAATGPGDVMGYALAAFIGLPPLLRRLRRECPSE